jgi:polyferredoxin
MEKQSELIQKEDTPEKLVSLERLSDLLDNKFRIPGTQIRFGFDFLIGLVPYAGDLLTFGFSGMLIMSMVKHGASGMLILKMIWNILIDMVVGSIPFFGDIFDLKFKANRRNYLLLREHYTEEKHKGRVWPVLLLILLLLLFLLGLSVYISWKTLQWIFS